MNKKILTPKKQIESDELNFYLKNVDSNNFNYRLTFDSMIEKPGKGFADVWYFCESKHLQIKSIDAQIGDGKRVNLFTKKTLELFLENFEIDSVSFKDVYEENLVDFVSNYELYSIDFKTGFDLENICGFNGVPFLMTLNEFGFYDVTYKKIDDSFFDYIKGAKK